MAGTYPPRGPKPIDTVAACNDLRQAMLNQLAIDILLFDSQISAIEAMIADCAKAIEVYKITGDCYDGTALEDYRKFLDTLIEHLKDIKYARSVFDSIQNQVLSIVCETHANTTAAILIRENYSKYRDGTLYLNGGFLDYLNGIGNILVNGYARKHPCWDESYQHPYSPDVGTESECVAYRRAKIEQLKTLHEALKAQWLRSSNLRPLAETGMKYWRDGFGNNCFQNYTAVYDNITDAGSLAYHAKNKIESLMNMINSWDCSLPDWTVQTQEFDGLVGELTQALATATADNDSAQAALENLEISCPLESIK